MHARTYYYCTCYYRHTEIPPILPLTKPTATVQLILISSLVRRQYLHTTTSNMHARLRRPNPSLDITNTAWRASPTPCDTTPNAQTPLVLLLPAAFMNRSSQAFLSAACIDSFVHPISVCRHGICPSPISWHCHLSHHTHTLEIVLPHASS
jgi:hypothetical protein